MPNKVKFDIEPGMRYEDCPQLEDMLAGRRYVTELYGRAEAYDHVQFMFWRDYLRSLAISCFAWEGVPGGIDVRAMEYICLMFGQGAMFVDGGHMFAQAAPSSLINMYYNPNNIQLLAPNGLTWVRHCGVWTLDGEMMAPDAVMLYDSLLRAPLDMYLTNYARRLATIDRISDVNVEAQKTPWVIYGSEEAQRNTNRLIAKLEANEKYIKANADAPLDNMGLTVLRTDAPYVADKLDEHKQRVLNEAVTLVGVDNTNQEKRERMIDAEATANNEQIMTLRRSRLQARRDFCEKCNEMFGLNISVKWGVPHRQEPTGADDELEGWDDDNNYGGA